MQKIGARSSGRSIVMIAS